MNHIKHQTDRPFVKKISVCATLSTGKGHPGASFRYLFVFSFPLLFLVPTDCFIYCLFLSDYPYFHFYCYCRVTMPSKKLEFAGFCFFFLVLNRALFFVVWLPWLLKLTDFHIHHYQDMRKCFVFKIAKIKPLHNKSLPNGASMLRKPFL